MEKLKGISFAQLPYEKLTKVTDLINYEGPLLSHFVSEAGENYLFYWVDVNDSSNRWLVIQISYEKLLRYLDRKIPLREIIINPSNGFLFSVDIDEDLIYKNVLLIQPKELPASYIPNDKSYYEFEPVTKEIDLISLSKKYDSGLLQAYIRNSSKVGYGTIYLSILTPALQSIGEMGEVIANGLWNKSVAKATKEKKNTNGEAKNRYLMAGQYEFVTTFPGSFSIILRPISPQTSIEGNKDEADEVADSLINFIHSSYSIESLKTSIEGIDYKVVSEYQHLLKTISDAKLEFTLRWANARSNNERGQVITYKDADKILTNISGLEYENIEQIEMTGHFVEVNLRSRHYIFEAQNSKTQSTGYFASNLENSTSRISFDKKYDVVISRAEKKEAVKSTPIVKDIIISIKER